MKKGLVAMDKKELMIKVLKEANSLKTNIESDQLANKSIFDEYDNDLVNEVIVQLVEDEYIKGKIHSTFYGNTIYMVYGLTSAGSKLLKSS